MVRVMSILVVLFALAANAVAHGSVSPLGPGSSADWIVASPTSAAIDRFDAHFRMPTDIRTDISVTLASDGDGGKQRADCGHKTAGHSSCLADCVYLPAQAGLDHPRSCGSETGRPYAAMPDGTPFAPFKPPIGLS